MDSARPVGPLYSGHPCPIFILSGISVYDASRDANGNPATCSTATMSVSPASGRSTLTYAVPRSWLADSARIYPVTIDPSITLNPNPGNNPNCDTRVTSGYPDSSNGASAYLATGYNAGGNLYCRSLVAFDLSSYTGAYIHSATFQLYKTNGHGGTPTTYLRPMSKTWSSGSTWNSLGSQVNSFPSSYCGAVIGSGSPAGSAWLSVDCTATVQSWVSGSATDYGFLVQQTENTSSIYSQWESSDNAGDQAHWPELVLNYDTPSASVTTDATSYAASATAAITVTTSTAFPNDVQRMELGLNLSSTDPTTYRGVLGWFKTAALVPSTRWHTDRTLSDGSVIANYSDTANPTDYGANDLTVNSSTCSDSSTSSSKSVKFSVTFGAGFGSLLNVTPDTRIGMGPTAGTQTWGTAGDLSHGATSSGWTQQSGSEFNVGATVLQPGVRMMDSATLSALSSVSPLSNNSQTFTFTKWTPQLAGLAVNSVFYMPPVLAQGCYGGARIVGAVNSGAKTVTTTVGSLSQAIKSGTMPLTGVLVPGSLNTVVSLGPITADGNVNTNGNNLERITIKGFTLENGLTVLGHFDINKIVLTGGINYAAAVSGAASLWSEAQIYYNYTVDVTSSSNASLSYDAPDLMSIPVMIAPAGDLPAVLVTNVQVGFEASGSLQMGVSASFQKSGVYTVGLNWDQKSNASGSADQPTDTTTSSASKNCHVYGSFSIGAGLTVGVNEALDDTGSIYMSTSLPELDYTVRQGQDPWWTLGLGEDFQAGIEDQVPGLGVGLSLPIIDVQHDLFTFLSSDSSGQQAGDNGTAVKFNTNSATSEYGVPKHDNGSGSCTTVTRAGTEFPYGPNPSASPAPTPITTLPPGASGGPAATDGDSAVWLTDVNGSGGIDYTAQGYPYLGSIWVENLAKGWSPVSVTPGYEIDEVQVNQKAGLIAWRENSSGTCRIHACSYNPTTGACGPIFAIEPNWIVMNSFAVDNVANGSKAVVVWDQPVDGSIDGAVVVPATATVTSPFTVATSQPGGSEAMTPDICADLPSGRPWTVVYSMGGEVYGVDIDPTTLGVLQTYGVSTLATHPELELVGKGSGFLLGNDYNSSYPKIADSAGQRVVAFGWEPDDGISAQEECLIDLDKGTQTYCPVFSFCLGVFGPSDVSLCGLTSSTGAWVMAWTRIRTPTASTR